MSSSNTSTIKQYDEKLSLDNEDAFLIQSISGEYFFVLAATLASIGTPRVVKKEDEIRSNTDVLTDDSELVIPVKSGKLYGFKLVLKFNGSLAADLKYSFNLSNAGTVEFINGPLSSATSVGRLEAGDPITVDVATNPRFVVVVGTIDATNSGDFSVQWAQSVADSELTRVLKGSHLVLWEELPS